MNLLTRHENNYTTRSPYPRNSVSYNKPKIRPVFNIMGYLSVNNSKKTKEQILQDTQNIFLNWLKTKGGVPAEAYAGKSFTGLPLPHLELYATSSCISIENNWGVQVVDDDKKVLGRKWTTEIYLDSSEEFIKCTVRQTVTLGLNDDEYLIVGLPSFIQEIADKIGFFDDDHGFMAEPWEVDNQPAFESFYKLLLNKNRSRPILVITLDRSGNTDVNVEKLSRRCLGMAHVVVLDPQAWGELTERVGFDFTVHSGAIRTYQPNFSIYTSEPYEHPLIIASKIKNYISPKYQNSRENFLIDQLSKSCTASLLQSRELPSFSALRKHKIDFDNELRLQGLESQNKSALSPETDNKIRQVNEILEELQAQIKQLSDEQEYFLDIADTAEKENSVLKNKFEAKNSDYEELLKEFQKTSNELNSYKQVSTSYPSSLDDLRTWYQTNLEGKLTLLPRAFRSAKKSQFSDPVLVYKALELLANEYPKVKKGLYEKQLLDQKFSELGLEETPTLNENQYDSHGDEYIVQWNGERRELDTHIKKGNRRENRYCLRIYYFWCDEIEQVVVGSLPSHLTTSQT